MNGIGTTSLYRKTRKINDLRSYEFYLVQKAHGFSDLKQDRSIPEMQNCHAYALEIRQNRFFYQTPSIQ